MKREVYLLVSTPSRIVTVLITSPSEIQLEVIYLGTSLIQQSFEYGDSNFHHVCVTGVVEQRYHARAIE